MEWKIFYDDKESIKQKVGTLVGVEEGLVYIKQGKKTIAIPISRIIRMEETQ